MDMGHVFSEQVIGLGRIITISDLSNDGLYGIPSFRNTGFKWLVAPADDLPRARDIRRGFA